MTEEEIKDRISKVEGIDGMTVNERLFVSGLMDEYDKVKWSDKPKAKRILELLGVDEPSVNKIVKPSTTRKQIIYVTILLTYLLVITQTEYSLVGFWTDILFSLVFSLITLIAVFRNKTDDKFLTYFFRAITLISFISIYGFFIYMLTNPFVIDTFKLRSFYYQSVDNRLFNAYFKPVGSYSGGEGNFWITETPKLFPIVEKQVFYDRTVLHDFNDDTFEGEPIDNYKVVEGYIKDEVINKKNE
jgi:hypothetical protein